MADDRVPHSCPTVTPGLVEVVRDVVESGQHAGGAVRRAFEEDLAARVGVRHGVAVQTGSAALHLALLALDVRPGDPVLLPTYACMAVLNAVTACGARPILTDVSPDRLNLGTAEIETALAREELRATDLRAAIVPHMVGSPSPAHELVDAPYPVIEDCAMALGAELADEEVGAWGVISTFSFYATKMISTGQGGMLLTDDARIHDRATDLIQYDNRDAWHGTTWNYPLPDLAAAMGRAQLPHLESFLARRRELATHYRDFAQRHGLAHQQHRGDATPNHYRFVLLIEDRDRIQALLAERGIDTKPPVFRPLHRYLGHPDRHFPGATQADREALSLPIYPGLDDAALERVLAALDQIF
ncbi:MAG: DegT/DnrJ/EryC1/StrS family aminotransferase [Planctomycetota bacterium]